MKNSYSTWKEALKGSPDGQKLDQMSHDEIHDAFSRNVTFGTGGLRAIMGLGTNRLNRYTIERITHGLAKVVLSGESPKSIGIAYDTRHNSEEYAKIVYNLLISYGINVYIFNKPMPTPTLSFAIRDLKLGWGVCITASHNPQEYNGYKVYDQYGIQVTDKIANKITDSINKVDYFEPVPTNQNKSFNFMDSEIEEAYFNKIVSFVHPSLSKSDYKLVYSALHGTGINAIPNVLRKLGFSPIYIQENHDGSFGGLKTPNPEEPVVYDKAIKKAKEIGAKLLLATDPDCDRVGVMVNGCCGFELLTGNQIGALLIDYLIQTRGVSKGDIVISTIVSGLLGELIADEYGLEFVRLLTGFKYIGEYIENLPKEKKFYFGYEESYGYLADDEVRDKDAVIATALIVKMADYYNSKGMTLLDRLFELNEKHGYCLESLHSLNIPQSRQIEIMNKLRHEMSSDSAIRSEDYIRGANELPPADVLKIYTKNNNSMYKDSWVAIRPSGTEPKLKLYVGVHAETHEEAKRSMEFMINKFFAKLEV